ncbi:hypothetical protein PRIPAC_78507 [Pristionchus pacificus]|uniref:G protein-coupled receptor n=1 Tax=Pristionchus pacificus TaxID=54126 RepID=A0A2A6CQM0_PRIPA|nr:hypothetical protein PRIPAC_78507 [Pristionchus pacificus]|eukprot:PDM80333.1 G protein-coupled receptor [Pristionchus pacificus]
MNISKEVLEDAEYHANSLYLKIVCEPPLTLTVRISFASMALIFLTALHMNRNKFMAHPSLKNLLNFHFLWISLTCLFVVIDHGYTAYSLAIMRNPSDLIQSEMQCLLRKGAPCVAIYGSRFICTDDVIHKSNDKGAISSMFMMSFERNTASVCCRIYERTSLSYGYKLVFVHIILAGVFSVSYFVTYGYREPVVVLYTITTPRGETNHQIVATIMLALELWTIFSFVRLLHINRKKQKQKGGFYSLTERFQIAENVRMLKIMLPIVWSHVSVTCVSIVIYLAVVANGLTDRNFPLFEDSISLTFLQGFFMPYFFFRQFREEVSHKRKVIATNKATGETLNTVHSAVIETGWR